jgi:ABC-2 type transport system permease protein
VSGLKRMVVKELQQVRRDRRFLAILFVSPVIQLILLGYAANLDVRQIPTIVCDYDHTVESRALAASLTASGFFQQGPAAPTVAVAERALETGRAWLALVIPRGYGVDVLAGRPTAVQLLVDGSDSSAATVGASYATQAVARVGRGLAQRAAAAAGAPAIATIDVQPRVWYNPDLRSSHFMVPGMLGLLLMLVTMVLTALAIVKEKENGTLEQLSVTPITPAALILGKLIPFVMIGLIDVLLVVAAATVVFGLPVKGSVLLLLALSLLFILTSLGLGLFVSTLASTQQQAMMMAVFFVMVPMVFLSGFVFPVENMPPVIQGVTYLMPLRYYFTIVRGLFLKGVGPAELADEAAALAISGAVVFGLSLLRFRKRLG